MDSAINAAKDLVREAAILLLDSIDESKVVSKTGTANFVTEVDIKVQEFIVARLKEILPQSNIIAEETAHQEFFHGAYTWILDPVDGTTNLMYGYKYSAISLGLLKDGIAHAGIVYNPFIDEMFFAVKGCGAFVNDQPIKVTRNKKLSDSLITFGTSPYDRAKADETFRITKNVFDKCRDIRRSGSAALDLCNVAAGRMDGFYEMELQPWDYAASALILQEAGGRISDWYGKPVDFLNKLPVVASNGYIHEELLEELK